MFNAHSKASVAQVAFYVPALILAAVLRRRHGRPRMPWLILALFCISEFCFVCFSPCLTITVRIACGIVVVLLQNKPSNVGLIIPSLILLNAGVFPLIAATVGFMRIM